jgi:uncharacterized phage-associated protein
MRQITFKPRKAVEASLYVASKLEKPTVHEVLKLLYFADKCHLREYGFLALGDRYFAMDFGPVAECTYDMLKIARGEKSRWYSEEMIAAVEGALSVAGSNVTPLRSPSKQSLSASYISALEEALRQFGDLSFKERTELSHDEAWKKAWEKASEQGQKRYRMESVDIARTLENADQVLEHMVGGKD